MIHLLFLIDAWCSMLVDPLVVEFLLQKRMRGDIFSLLFLMFQVANSQSSTHYHTPFKLFAEFP